MDLEEAKEILNLVASAQSGVSVEFLTKPEDFRAFVFVGPASFGSTRVDVDLLAVTYSEGLPLSSRRWRFPTPKKALEMLMIEILPRLGKSGKVSKESFQFLECIFAACQYDTFHAALWRVKEEVWDTTDVASGRA
jgi:hypothetical protein